jgi:Flp pilus assembly protein TadG
MPVPIVAEMRDGTTDLQTRRAWRRRCARRRSDRGAALVEFSFVALPLFLLLFAVIEFGWAFFQLNDIRHGAREGIRLVAVDADPTPMYTGADMDTQGERIAQATCERMSKSDGVTVTITLTDLQGNSPEQLEVGDDATLVTSKKLDQLTHAFAPFLNNVFLDETVTTRLEQSPGTAVDNTTWTCK